MLLPARGNRPHRWPGDLWVTPMVATALAVLAVRTIRPGHFSPIHLLSLYRLVMLPTIVTAVRGHDMVRSRGALRGMVLGALLIAGFFTFPFNRLLLLQLFG